MNRVIKINMFVDQEVEINKPPPKKSFLHSTLIIIAAILIFLNVSMIFVYFITGDIESFLMIAIASAAGILLGPIFLMVLGSYLARSRSLWQRVGFGIFVFLIFYVLDLIYRWLNEHPFLTETWPSAPFYAQLVFIPTYAVLSIALSTIYLYLLPQKQNFVGRILRSREHFWTRYLVPLFLLTSAWIYIYGISILSIKYTILLMVVNSLLSIGALPNLKEKLEEQLGHRGSQIFTVIILGYSSSFTIITSIQFGGISFSNVDYFFYFVQSNMQMASWPSEMRITTLTVLKVLVDFCAIITSLYLAYVIYMRNEDIVNSSVRICKHSFSFVLPIVLILTAASYVILQDTSVYVESIVNDSENSQNRTGKITWMVVGNSNSTLVITVCGEEEHNSTYSIADTTIFGGDSYRTEDNYTVQRTILTKNPSKQFIDSFDVDLECSELKLIPVTEWTTLNTIVSTNSSFVIVYIDGDGFSNLHIATQNTETDYQPAAYTILICMILVPVYFVSIWRNKSKLANQKASNDELSQV